MSDSAETLGFDETIDDDLPLGLPGNWTISEYTIPDGIDHQEHYRIHMLHEFEDRECLIDAETIKNIKLKQSCNSISITIKAIIDSLEHIMPISIIKIIYSILYSPQIESTMMMSVTGFLRPYTNELVPCVMISIPCCSESMISYRLSSMKLQLENIKRNELKGGGKYYVCIQEFECDEYHCMPPNHPKKQVLYKSDLFETECISRCEECFINNINLELMNDTLYLLYLITELSEKLSVENYQRNCVKFNPLSLVSKCDPKDSKLIGFPCFKNEKILAKLSNLSMTTHLNFDIKKQKYIQSNTRTMMYQFEFHIQ